MAGVTSLMGPETGSVLKRTPAPRWDAPPSIAMMRPQIAARPSCRTTPPSVSAKKRANWTSCQSQKAARGEEYGTQGRYHRRHSQGPLKIFWRRRQNAVTRSSNRGGLIEKVPAHKLITTSLLCQKLTQQFNVQGTCPVTTQKALQAVAHDPSSEVAYWRVIKANGGLMTRFPGGAEGQAERLRKEGFALDGRGKAPKVKKTSEIASFASDSVRPYIV